MMNTESTIIEKFAKESAFDTKHKLNLKRKSVPTDLLSELEKGCSIETLEKLFVDYPICKYKTQITIHGLFSAPTTNYIGGYKNLIQNQNKSIGVRWSAIDVEKKNKLYRTMMQVDDHWHIDRDSQVFQCCQYHKCTTKADVIEKYKELKAFAEGMSTANFVGSIYATALCLYGKYYAKLTFNVLCYYESNFEALLDDITKTTPEERRIKIEANEAAARAKAEEQAREREQRQKEYEARQRERAEALEQWKADHNPEEGFIKVTDYTLQKEDVYCLDARYKGYWTDEISYQYFVVGLSFGKLVATPCTPDGKTNGKGSVLDNTTLKSGYVKQTATAKPEQTATAKSKPEYKSNTDTKATEQPKSSLSVIDYSDKAWAVVGNTKPLADKFKDMGGRFNPRLTCGAGWIFSKKRCSKAELLKVAAM